MELGSGISKGHYCKFGKEIVEARFFHLINRPEGSCSNAFGGNSKIVFLLVESSIGFECISFLGINV